MKPLIVLLKTPNANYFFDANKDEMISVNEESFRYLSCLQADENTEIGVMPPELLELKEQGYLKTESNIKEISHAYNEYLEFFLDRKLAMLTLQLTQDCNLRCKYCIYSEEHSSRQRSHSIKSISWEIAKKAVDFFLAHSIDNPEVNIGFYGGEPLLEFSLLKRIIEYAKECFAGRKLTFNMTTNATLLTDEMILYLKEQDVTMMISLDGPKEINDLNRIFIDGSGTFDTVSERVSRIKEICPDYAEKLMISMVMDPENDFDCINAINIDGSEFNKLTISPTLVEREYGEENPQFSSNYVWKTEYQFFLAMLSHYGRYPKEDVSPIADSRLARSLDEYTRTCSGSFLRETDVPSGPCIPGQMRLFVNVDGLLFPCERVSEKSQAMCIGSLDEGFNLEKAKDVLGIGTLTKEECKKCWCFRYCSLCAKKADDEFGKLSAEVKLSFCNEAKSRAYQNLEQYLLFKEIPQFYSRQLSIKEEEL
ncbi:MAG: Cys-rich peptide radical SAM maturase CcpM [Lachnospiraceae bacterium]|nr:Cys-rich peptide radical SAM maturase CcpM [Lachnospiraceae bacterium]